MKKIFGISLISLAVSILLLHSFVPHHHSPEDFDLQEILKKEPTESPIDLLKIGFHLNLGSNHLENFQKNSSVIPEKKIADKEKSKTYDFIPSSLKLDLILRTKKTVIVPPKTNGAIQIQFNNSFTYRGPPFLA